MKKKIISEESLRMQHGHYDFSTIGDIYAGIEPYVGKDIESGETAIYRMIEVCAHTGFIEHNFARYFARKKLLKSPLVVGPTKVTVRVQYDRLMGESIATKDKIYEFEIEFNVEISEKTSKLNPHGH